MSVLDSKASLSLISANIVYLSVKLAVISHLLCPSPSNTSFGVCSMTGGSVEGSCMPHAIEGLDSQLEEEPHPSTMSRTCWDGLQIYFSMGGFGARTGGGVGA